MGKTGLYVYLRTCSSILDLAGVEALQIGVFHAGEDACAAEAHWVDGTLVMKQHSVSDNLESRQKFLSMFCLFVVVVFYYQP